MSILVLIVGIGFSTSIAVCGMWLMISSVTAHWGEQLCPACGYDLRGRSDQHASHCSECGCTLDRGDSPYIERKFSRAVLGFALLIASCVGFLITAVLGM
jgi:hypothetical protein